MIQPLEEPCSLGRSRRRHRLRTGGQSTCAVARPENHLTRAYENRGSLLTKVARRLSERFALDAQQASVVAQRVLHDGSPCFDEGDHRDGGQAQESLISIVQLRTAARRLSFCFGTPGVTRNDEPAVDVPTDRGGSLTDLNGSASLELPCAGFTPRSSVATEMGVTR